MPGVLFERPRVRMRRVLEGRRIVVTRPRAAADDLGERLTALGAEVVYCPAFRIVPPADPAPFQAAVAALNDFDWVVITSANGARALGAEIRRQGLPEAVLRDRRVACVGPATASALRAEGVDPQVIPDVFVGARVADALAPQLHRGARVLLARAAGADRELPDRLRGLGAQVTDVQAYASAPDLPNATEIAALLDAEAVDMITFTSPSAVSYFVSGVDRTLSGVGLAVIGPVTADRLRALGLEPAVIAQEHTVSGLVDGISRFLNYRTTDLS